MAEDQTERPISYLENVINRRDISPEIIAAARFNAKAAIDRLLEAGLTRSQTDAVLTVMRNNFALNRAHLTEEATGTELPDIIPNRDDLAVIQDWGLALWGAMKDLLPTASALHPGNQPNP